jgi:hypothetical protein
MSRKIQLILVITGLMALSAVSRAIQSTVTSSVNRTNEIAIPFQQVNRHILLKVRVDNSEPLSFVFDTGSQFAIINLERAREMGLKLQGAVRMGGAGSDTTVGAFVQESSFTIPGLPGFSQPIELALPLSNLSPRAGHDFDGIIGSEFIQKFVLSQA